MNITQPTLLWHGRELPLIVWYSEFHRLRDFDAGSIWESLTPAQKGEYEEFASECDMIWMENGQSDSHRLSLSEYDSLPLEKREEASNRAYASHRSAFQAVCDRHVRSRD